MRQNNNIKRIIFLLSVCIWLATAGIIYSKEIYSSLKENIFYLSLVSYLSHEYYQQDNPFVSGNILVDDHKNIEIPQKYLIDAEKIFENNKSPAALRETVYLLDISHNEKGIIDLASNNSDICIKDVVCRFIAGKAAYHTGVYDLAKIWWADERIKPYVIRYGEILSDGGKNYLDGIQYYDFVEGIFPDELKLYEDKVAIYSYYGKWNDALIDLEQARRIDQNNQLINCFYGEALVYTRKNINQGISICELALSKEQNNVWLYEKLAALYIYLGDKETARQVLQRAIEKFPDREEPVFWLNNLNGKS